jgi:protein-disulfide isomerase
MEKHNIKIMLSPPDKVRPTVDLSSVDVHFEGNLESGNSVVLIGNPDCDGCRQLKPITDSLYKKYSGIIKFGFVYFDNIVTLSSLALEGAIRQHKFIEMSDLLYKYPMQPDTLSLLKLAKDIKLDTAKLHMFITASEPTTSIQKNIARLQDKGIYTTPVLIINNKMFSAPFNFDEIDAYLTKLID